MAVLGVPPCHEKEKGPSSFILLFIRSYDNNIISTILVLIPHISILLAPPQATISIIHFIIMGCCCSKRNEAAFVGEGHRLGTADEHRTAKVVRDAADDNRSAETPKPYTDVHLTEYEREKIREERLAAAEGRLTKQERNAMKQKKTSNSDSPLRGPNSQNTMRWTAG